MTDIDGKLAGKLKEIVKRHQVRHVFVSIRIKSLQII